MPSIRYHSNFLGCKLCHNANHESVSEIKTTCIFQRKGAALMRSICFSSLCVALSLGGLLSVNISHAQLDKASKPAAKADKFPVRSLEVTRFGEAYARPNTAIISFPFKVEGMDMMEIHQKETALRETFRKIALPLDASGQVGMLNGVGQTYHDGKPSLYNYGTLQIRVFNLAALKAIGIALAKATSESLTVSYDHFDEKMTETFRRRAQQNAIGEAKKQAEFLAKTAGTRIISVLKLEDEFVRTGFPSVDPSHQPDEWKLPPQILVASAVITIVYELAPPQNQTKPIKPQQSGKSRR